MDAAILEKEALLLPDTERALLVERLMESISPSPSALREAWVREADERMRAFRAGEISAVDGPQAIAELRSRFSK
ncbi:MAG: addiction module protein [Terrimicrobiaceae bacterium]|jgi:putative addiction module component (TIGR02574 family)